MQPRCQTVGAGKNEDHPDDECPQDEQPDKGKEIDAEGKECNAPREVKEQLDLSLIHIFLAVSAILNIVLDLFFVITLDWGVGGAAGATVLAQYVSGLGLAAFTVWRFPELLPRREHRKWDGRVLREIAGLSGLTSVQQSVMNFGILMVQGRVNSFGPSVMAAFAAAVKIDSFAYMPVQDFGNAFSTFVAQNFGAGKADRIRGGIRSAAACAAAFCVVVGGAVCLFALSLIHI